MAYDAVNDTNVFDDDALNTIVAKLNEAQEILTKEMPLPDMSIEEFNVTPLGRAIYCIQTVLELIVED